jgi:hypothetical protein
MTIYDKPTNYIVYRQRIALEICPKCYTSLSSASCQKEKENKMAFSHAVPLNFIKNMTQEKLVL